MKLGDYELTPEERARMDAHLAGGGDLGSWQRGDMPPSPDRWYGMSQNERDLLGLSERGTLGSAWEGFQARMRARNAGRGSPMMPQTYGLEPEAPADGEPSR